MNTNAPKFKKYYENIFKPASDEDIRARLSEYLKGGVDKEEDIELIDKIFNMGSEYVNRSLVEVILKIIKENRDGYLPNLHVYSSLYMVDFELLKQTIINLKNDINIEVKV